VGLLHPPDHKPAACHGRCRNRAELLCQGAGFREAAATVVAVDDVALVEAQIHHWVSHSTATVATGGFRIVFNLNYFS